MIAVVAYYCIYYINSTALEPPYNLTNTTGLNSQQKLFLADLSKAGSVNDLSVTYLQWNLSAQGTTTNVTYGMIMAELQNKTVEINLTENQTLKSYVLGADRKALWAKDSIARYRGGIEEGQIAASNFTNITYYDTHNTVLICTNESLEVSGITNSSLKCSRGYGLNTGFLISPFSLTNVSWMGYMTHLSHFTYNGTETIIGRSCDEFSTVNWTRPGELNWTFQVCLDKSYGIPLYYNETSYENGTWNTTFTFGATNLSQDVSPSEFVISPAMLNATD